MFNRLSIVGRDFFSVNDKKNRGNIGKRLLGRDHFNDKSEIVYSGGSAEEGGGCTGEGSMENVNA